MGRIRKSLRSYLLLEVVIALALIAAASPFIFDSCFQLVRRKQELKRELEASRVADLAFAAVKQLFYEQDFKWWTRLGSNPKVKPDLNLPYKVAYDFVINQQKRKDRSENHPLTTYRLLTVTIMVNDLSFDYQLMVERRAPKKEGLIEAIDAD